MCGETGSCRLLRSSFEFHHRYLWCVAVCWADAMRSVPVTARERMSTLPFVHLHCHSHYSLLDGASPIDKLIARAKSLGMNGLALTDYGNLHRALEFYQPAKKEGINPIRGYEAYIAPDSRLKRDAGNLKEASYHLTLLAQNR